MKILSMGSVAAVSLLAMTAVHAVSVPLNTVYVPDATAAGFNDSSRFSGLLTADNNIYFFQEQTVSNQTSWFVTWNPFDNSSSNKATNATIDFSSFGVTINSVITSTAALNNTDFSFGLAAGGAHTYDQASYRGLEFGGSTPDAAPTGLGGSILTLSSLNVAGTGIDQLRVLTTAVPLPAAAWLFASALVGVGVVARRRKSNKGSAAAAA